MTSQGTTAGTAARTAPVQRAAQVVGVIFLLVGVLGFIPGITTHYGDMEFGGRTSDAHLLGLFQVSVLHNMVHLLYGAAGLALAKHGHSARVYFLVGGAIYLALCIYGLMTGDNSLSNFVPLNTADNWLHLFLGVAMIGIGVVLSRRPPSGGR